MYTYTIILDEMDISALDVFFDIQKKGMEKAVELAPESELIKEHLERLTALERKISAQVVDNTYVQTTAPNCQGQCGICDGTCNNAVGQQRHF